MKHAGQELMMQIQQRADQDFCFGWVQRFGIEFIHLEPASFPYLSHTCVSGMQALFAAWKPRGGSALRQVKGISLFAMDPGDLARCGYVPSTVDSLCTRNKKCREQEVQAACCMRVLPPARETCFERPPYQCPDLWDLGVDLDAMLEGLLP
eukprot:scaffold545_cov226-Pinguiococcus_pyrenoidosus.AAC.1